MPLVRDFFRKMFSRFPMDDRAGIEFVQSVADDFGVSPQHMRDDRLHIEELLTLLDCHASWHSGEKDESRRTTSFPEVIGALAARDSLSYMMAGLLFDAQRAAFECQTPLHHQLAQRLDLGDTIISYNYDLVVEYALATAQRFSPANYHVPFFGQIEGADFGYSDIEAFDPSDAAGIDLLKLHGSLNWLHRKHEYLSRGRKTSELPLGETLYLVDAFQVFIPPGSSGKVFSLLDVPNEDDDPADPEFIDLVPVIVAPTFEKSIVWAGFNGVLRSLWQRAHAALAASTHLAIIGYSLRDADFQSMWLFRTALAQSRSERAIWVVNPSEPDRTRLSSILGDYGKVYVAETFAEYLARTA